MKKIISIIILFIIITLAIINSTVLATNSVSTVLGEEKQSQVLNMKNENNDKIKEYAEKYDSEAYGLAAYVLNIARIYSIPICFIGIIIGALNQYILGTRRLDKKHKGFGIIMTFVTLLVICQVLPLIFTIVVIGWRG